MRKLVFLSILSLMLGLFTSCAMNKAQTGAGIGALGGAAIGGQLGKSKHRGRNALLGAAAGMLVGYIVGNEMDKADQAKLSRTLETVPSNQTIKWTNPDTHKQYAVTPMPAYYHNHRPCRDAYIEAVIDGEVKQTKTTACRNANGVWEIIK